MNNILSENYLAYINQVLFRYLPPTNIEPQRLHEAMHYAVLNGGKRIRPLLVYAAGRLFDADALALDAAACAVEFIHAYSLIHDDLPAMDDDDLRRGRPTCHIAFDEATAILAGDALQSLAFSVLANVISTNLSAHNHLLMIKILADASGSLGMAGGQALDLLINGQQITADRLELIHKLKTGALIGASAKLGALCSNNCTEQALRHLDNFANNIGLAFQIQDDILDIEGNTATLGKQQGKDYKHNKPTYPVITTMAVAKTQVKTLYNNAIASLTIFGEKSNDLRDLANFIIQRNY